MSYTQVVGFGYRPHSISFAAPTVKNQEYQWNNSVETLTLESDANLSLVNHMFGQFKNLTSLDISAIMDDIMQAKVIQLIAQNNVPIKELYMTAIDLPPEDEIKGDSYVTVFSKLNLLGLNLLDTKSLEESALSVVVGYLTGQSHLTSLRTLDILASDV
jgi:hypothetical protein